MKLLLRLLAMFGIGGKTLERVLAIEAMLNKYASLPALHRRLVEWVMGTLAAGEAVDIAVDGFNWLKEGARQYLEKILNQQIIELSKEELLDAAGRAGAEELDAQITARFGISFPIPNLYSETLPNELGEWFADIVNMQISKRLGYEVEPFTTLFPYENIVPELDTFISTMLSNALGVQVTSIMNVQTLKQEIETAIFQTITNQVNEAFTIAKGQMQNQIFTQLENTGLTETQKHAINDVITEQFAALVLNLNGLLPTQMQARKFYFSPTKRLHNKLRQRKFRKTHRMQTNWVLRDNPLP